jgi:molybdenum cofactor biosynthesis protein B
MPKDPDYGLEIDKKRDIEYRHPHDMAIKIKMSTQEHKKTAPRSVAIGIVTVSSTRSLEDDLSGHWIREHAIEDGHTVVSHQVVPDDSAAIVATVLAVIRDKSPRVLLVTGGTGISPKDLTIEALGPLFSKVLAAFGPLFAQLSYQQIGSAALLSRSTAGVLEGTVVFCLPGSLKACQLACRKLIFPELGHLVRHLQEG